MWTNPLGENMRAATSQWKQEHPHQAYGVQQRTSVHSQRFISCGKLFQLSNLTSSLPAIFLLFPLFCSLKPYIVLSSFKILENTHTVPPTPSPGLQGIPSNLSLPFLDIGKFREQPHSKHPESQLYPSDTLSPQFNNCFCHLFFLIALQYLFSCFICALYSKMVLHLQKDWDNKYNLNMFVFLTSYGHFQQITEVLFLAIFSIKFLINSSKQFVQTIQFLN